MNVNLLAQNLVGRIIGRGGSKINEIRDNTGANIQVSKGYRSVVTRDPDYSPAAERMMSKMGYQPGTGLGAEAQAQWFTLKTKVEIVFCWLLNRGV